MESEPFKTRWLMFDTTSNCSDWGASAPWSVPWPRSSIEPVQGATGPVRVAWSKTTLAFEELRFVVTVSALWESQRQVFVIARSLTQSCAPAPAVTCCGITVTGPESWKGPSPKTMLVEALVTVRRQSLSVRMSLKEPICALTCQAPWFRNPAPGFTSRSLAPSTCIVPELSRVEFVSWTVSEPVNSEDSPSNSSRAPPFICVAAGNDSSALWRLRSRPPYRPPLSIRSPRTSAPPGSEKWTQFAACNDLKE